MNHLTKTIIKLKQLSNAYGRETEVSFNFGLYRKIILKIQGSSYFFVLTRLYGISKKPSFIVSVYRNIFHPEFDYWLRDELYTSLGIDGLELLSDGIENIIFRDNLVGKIERYQSFYRLKRATRKREDKILKRGVK